MTESETHVCNNCSPSIYVASLLAVVVCAAPCLWPLMDAGLSGTIYLATMRGDPEIGSVSNMALKGSWKTTIRISIGLAMLGSAFGPMAVLFLWRRKEEIITDDHKRLFAATCVSIMPFIALATAIYFIDELLEAGHKGRVAHLAPQLESLCDALRKEWPLRGNLNRGDWTVSPGETDNIVWVTGGGPLLGWHENIGYTIERCEGAFVVDLASVGRRGESRFLVIGGSPASDKRELMVCGRSLQQGQWAFIDNRSILAKSSERRRDR